MIHLKTSPFKAQGWTVVSLFLNFEETGSFGQLELHFIRSHLPHEVFENQCFSLFSCQSWIGTFGIRDWIRPIMEDSFNLSLLSRFKTVLCCKTNSWSWWLKVASEITRTWMKSAWRINLLVWSDFLPEWRCSFRQQRRSNRGRSKKKENPIFWQSESIALPSWWWYDRLNLLFIWNMVIYRFSFPSVYSMFWHGQRPFAIVLVGLPASPEGPCSRFSNWQTLFDF